MIRIEDLSVAFGEKEVVKHVSLELADGEILGVVGESGCGKTTTGRSIIRLYDITGGSVYYKGERICAGIRSYRDNIRQARRDFKENKISKEELDEIVEKNKAEIKSAQADHKKWARTRAGQSQLTNEIQMIFQDPIASLDPRMTVREIISEGLVIQGERDKKVIDEKVYEMLELVGLVREHASRYPHEFSGGQRQRIGVARSIIMNPELIIADEPVSALDVSVQAQVINLLNELRERFGLTILFIAHDLSVVKYFSDRIGVMYYGKMVELADSDELFAHPLHPYTRSLLSAIPLPDPVYERQRRRITYNPLAEHDYSVDQPSFREVRPGHFVQCNEAEYQKILADLQAE